jgi:hypothetical protein
MERFRKYIPFISIAIALLGLYFNWKFLQEQRKYLNCKCHEEEGGLSNSLSPIR